MRKKTERKVKSKKKTRAVSSNKTKVYAIRLRDADYKKLMKKFVSIRAAVEYLARVG